MHEIGIVKYIIDALEKIAAEEKLTVVKSVTLDVGEASSIVPDFLLNGWEWAHVKYDFIKDADLKIEIVPAVLICEDCRKTFSTTKARSDCPFCQGSSITMLSGNECNIKSIEAC